MCVRKRLSTGTVQLARQNLHGFDSLWRIKREAYDPAKPRVRQFNACKQNVSNACNSVISTCVYNAIFRFSHFSILIIRANLVLIVFQWLAYAYLWLLDLWFGLKDWRKYSDLVYEAFPATTSVEEMQTRIAGANINEQSLLATDYLNRFNGVAMVL